MDAFSPVPLCPRGMCGSCETMHPLTTAPMHRYTLHIAMAAQHEDELYVGDAQIRANAEDGQEPPSSPDNYEARFGHRDDSVGRPDDGDQAFNPEAPGVEHSVAFTYAKFASFAEDTSPAPEPVAPRATRVSLPWLDPTVLRDNRAQIETFSCCVWNAELDQYEGVLLKAYEIALIPGLRPYCLNLGFDPSQFKKRIAAKELREKGLYSFDPFKEAGVLHHDCEYMARAYKGNLDPQCTNKAGLTGSRTWNGKSMWSLKWHCEEPGCPDGNNCVNESYDSTNPRSKKQDRLKYSHMMGNDFVLAYNLAQAVQYLLGEQTNGRVLTQPLVDNVIGKTIQKEIGISFTAAVYTNLAAMQLKLEMAENAEQRRGERNQKRQRIADKANEQSAGRSASAVRSQSGSGPSGQHRQGKGANLPRANLPHGKGKGSQPPPSRGSLPPPAQRGRGHGKGKGSKGGRAARAPSVAQAQAPTSTDSLLTSFGL